MHRVTDRLIVADWSPLLDVQAEDRAHRIGQTRPVTAHRFYTRDTVDVHMAELARGKLGMATALMKLSERTVAGGEVG